VLLPYGYQTEQALALSALFLLINVQHIFVGFVVSLWYPLARRPAPATDPARDGSAAAGSREP